MSEFTKGELSMIVSALRCAADIRRNDPKVSEQFSRLADKARLKEVTCLVPDSKSYVFNTYCDN